MRVEKRVKFFLSARTKSAQTQTEFVDRSARDTVLDRMRETDLDRLLHRDIDPQSSLERTLVQDFNTRLGYLWLSLKDQQFDLLTPPAELFSGVRPGLVFDFYDSTFVVSCPESRREPPTFVYRENVFGLLDGLETGRITCEIAQMLDKFDYKSCENGCVIVKVNDFRYETPRTWSMKLEVGDDVVTHSVLQKLSGDEALRCESDLALLRWPVICTDPSPDVARTESVADFRKKMWRQTKKRVRAEVTRPEAVLPRNSELRKLELRSEMEVSEDLKMLCVQVVRRDTMIPTL